MTWHVPCVTRIVAQASRLQISAGQVPSGPAKRRGIDSSRRTLEAANRNHDAVQAKARISSALRACRYSSRKQYTPHHCTAFIGIEKKKQKWCCNIVICVLAEMNRFCLTKQTIKKKNVTCEDGFWAEAFRRGGWCGLGGCLVGKFLFFRGAVHSARFLPADPLVFLCF